ncbi:unnamed protein product [Kluyveromyces dobzhanskii CBS 2104]|uniref:WGS project CCBQ000000000 data, contig 00102 n=1 Tax=Kluyveromyces dobzhanskii CBS 2104 TaxID=1427455 RepID=A0A0A8L4I8_9SACH|nr:unnamed protein product [Kluyveromyces dobzhanskii CBS 2104]
MLDAIALAATELLFKRHGSHNAESDVVTECESDNEYDGRDNMRVLALFIIMISSAMGAYFPILSSRFSFIRLPDWCFFIAKFFGSGVIVATGFIHLLEPAVDALSNSCLGGTFAEYPWAFGICLMSLFALFFSECITRYYTNKSYGFENDHVHSHFPSSRDQKSVDDDEDEETDKYNQKVDEENACLSDANENVRGAEVAAANPHPSMPGNNHFSHDKSHQDLANIGTPAQVMTKEKYHNQLLSVFILEFGILFHSVFVGLSLAVTGNDEFNTLFIVLVFHQMFEGLGLGARIAEVPWTHSKRFTPWLLALAFTLVAPIAIAIGIGVRHSYAPGSRTALIANGCFDAISAGILIYTGLVELMAHEFLYSDNFKGAHGLKKMLFAFFTMCWGAGLMALLGKWA